MILIVIVSSALLLDKIFAEPRRFHPLVGFGRVADWLEQKFNKNQHKRFRGLFALILAIVPLTTLVVVFENFIADNEVLHAVFSSVILYLAIGWTSLFQHARHIALPLIAGDLAKARIAVSYIVSRDTSESDQQAISKAAVESVLENGADAVFAPIFWFCVFGVPGVFVYRLSNTLDAMWGYKNSRFIDFGLCAARLDDVLNLIPARLTALSYALTGHTQKALSSWRAQGSSWESPNAGPVMAAGAGALNVYLGGAAVYDNQVHQRVGLGVQPQYGGQLASAESIEAACQLVNKSLQLWLAGLILLAACIQLMQSS
ncbi:MAG: adenosylcobinamide-phosphate synthase CbiB [Cycloclasticus sp.]